jgi:hypothetical protein
MDTVGVGAGNPARAAAAAADDDASRNVTVQSRSMGSVRDGANCTLAMSPYTSSRASTSPSSTSWGTLHSTTCDDDDDDGGVGDDRLRGTLPTAVVLTLSPCDGDIMRGLDCGTDDRDGDTTTLGSGT